MQTNISQLLQLPLFMGIREEDLPIMLDCLGAYKKNYQKGEMILLESNQVRSIGVIISGIVHMVKENAEGGQVLLVSMTEGEFFGESFSCGSRQAASVSFQAASHCQVLFLPFYKVVHSCKTSCIFHHRLIENVVRLIGDKNVRLMQKIEILSQKTLREKILSYLQYRMEEQGTGSVILHLGRQSLADYLCADRSALTRELARMQEDGLIRYEKNTFEILYN